MSRRTAASKGHVTVDGVTEMLTGIFPKYLLVTGCVWAQMIICFTGSSGHARLRSTVKAADVTEFNAGWHMVSFPC